MLVECNTELNVYVQIMKVQIINFSLVAAAIVIGIFSIESSHFGVHAIPPSTFGGVVDSFGRLTNSIKVCDI